MAGSRRSVNLTKHPFNNNVHSASACVTEKRLHGIPAAPDLNCVNSDSLGFGSRFTQEFGSLSSFRTIGLLKEDRDTRCFESSSTNSDPGLKKPEHRFVNGFASQIRHNLDSAAEYDSNSDEESRQSTISYEFDSDSGDSSTSRSSHCSSKAYKGPGPDDCFDDSYISSPAAPKTQSNNRFNSQTQPLRMTSTGASHSASDANDLEQAETNFTVWPTETAIYGEDRLAEAKTMRDQNVNLIAEPNGWSISGNSRESGNWDSRKLLQNGGLGMGGNRKGVEKSPCDIRRREMTAPKLIEQRCLDNTRNNNYDVQCTTVNDVGNGGEVGDLDNYLKNVRAEGENPGGICLVCQCGGKTKGNSQRMKRKRRKKRKAEYEVINNNNRQVAKKMTTIATPSGNCIPGKGEFDRLKQDTMPPHHFNGRLQDNGVMQGTSISTKSGPISKAQAKRMIRELRRTLRRVSAEIEELKKLTRSKKVNSKKMKTVEKTIKYQHAASSPKIMGVGIAGGTGPKRKKARRVTHSAALGPRPPEDHKFTLQALFPATPSLAVRDGELVSSYSMIVPRGSIPPRNHPLWTWTHGKRPLERTANM